MRPLSHLSYLYHQHPLLTEIQEREIALAQANRKLAAAEAKIDRLQTTHKRILAAAQRQQAVAR